MCQHLVPANGTTRPIAPFSRLRTRDRGGGYLPTVLALALGPQSGKRHSDWVLPSRHRHRLVDRSPIIQRVGVSRRSLENVRPVQWPFSRLKMAARLFQDPLYGAGGPCPDGNGAYGDTLRSRRSAASSTLHERGRLPTSYCQSGRTLLPGMHGHPAGEETGLRLKTMGAGSMVMTIMVVGR